MLFRSANQGAIYFDGAKFKVSETGGAYMDLVGGSGSETNTYTSSKTFTNGPLQIGKTPAASSGGRVLLSTTSPRSGQLEVYTHNYSQPFISLGRDMLQIETGGAVDWARPGLGFSPGNNNTIASTGSAVGLPEPRTLAFYTSDTTSLVERMRITQDGSIGIGTTNPQEQVEAAVTGGEAVFSGVTYHTTDANNYRSLMRMARARGTQASPSAVQANDNLGEVRFVGYTGATSGFQTAADIKVYAAKNATDGSPGYTPTEMIFETTADDGTRDTRVTISSGAEETMMIASDIGAIDTTLVLGDGTTGRNGEQYITYRNAQTGANAWMAGLQDDEGFDIAYGPRGEMRGGSSEILVSISSMTDSGNPNAAGATMKIRRYPTTNRSINAAGSVNASGADYAEWVAWPDPKPEPGTIVLHNGTPMVVSSPETAAYTGGDVHKEGTAILLAFIGQVPVRVRGAVRKGDYILRGDDGVGYAVADDKITFPQFRRAVGIAWEASLDDAVKRVMVAVGIK